MKLDATTSRRIRLTTRRRAVTIARGENERLSAGTLRVTLKLSKRTVTRLRRARRGTLSLRVVVTHGDTRRLLKKTIRLRR